MRGNCGGLWITVYGDNFAGNHDIWIDPATHIELWKGRWVCGDGKRKGHWDRCGVGADPGDNVAGVQFELIFWNGMVPGLINFWVDGQPIPIEIIIDDYPDPGIQSVEIVRSQDTGHGPFSVVSDEVDYGETLFVEVEFNTKPTEAKRNITLVWNGTSFDSIDVFATDDPRLYRSAPFVLREP